MRLKLDQNNTINVLYYVKTIGKDIFYFFNYINKENLMINIEKCCHYSHIFQRPIYSF